jgi:recombination protein RecT
MNQTLPAAGETQALHRDLTRMEDEFGKVLPAQIPAVKFVRTLMTAVQLNPQLLRCTRQSLLAAAMQAAQDGLLPDGRYGVIVPYNTKVGKKGEERWEQHAQWMPMILGVYQKLHNSGKLRDISAHVVYDGDFFKYEMGDEEAITHSPPMFTDRGKPIGVYAIAHTTTGVYREVMSLAEVEAVRAMSKSPQSPAWTKSWAEMAKVKCVKRLAKRLPLSTDDVDWLYREEEPEPAKLTPPPIKPQFGPEREPDWDRINAEAEVQTREMNEQESAPELPADVEPHETKNDASD